MTRAWLGIMKPLIEHLRIRRSTRTTLAMLALAMALGGTCYYAAAIRPYHSVDVAKLAMAVKTYAGNLRDQHLPVPESVSVKDLINCGLLSKADALGFQDVDVTMNPRADVMRPQDILARARLSDGYEIVALGDGSVQQLRK